MENPGALAGATGTKSEVEKLQDEGYPDARSESSAQHLVGDWNRARWNWLKAVTAAPDLPPSAKVLAQVLVTQAADHDSGECLWSTDSFAPAIGASVDTVKRAFRALSVGGWLIRKDGGGRGNIASIVFIAPRSLPRTRAAETKRSKSARSLASSGQKIEQAALRKQGRAAPFSGHGTRHKTVQPCAKKGSDMHFPPIPPYKDTPNNLQRAGDGAYPSKPICNLARVAHFGSEREAEWNAYLEQRSWPSLSDLGVLSSDSQGRGWEVPFPRPPSPSNAFETNLTARWVEWAISRLNERSAA